MQEYFSEKDETLQKRGSEREREAEKKVKIIELKRTHFFLTLNDL